MATVRLTQGLRSRITRNIETMFSSHKSAIIEKIRATGDSAYNALIPEHIRVIIAGLPKGYMQHSESLNVSYKYGTLNVNVESRMTRQMAMPSMFTQYGFSNREIDLQDPANSELCKVVLPLMQEFEAVKQQHDTLLSKTSALMDANGTVGLVMKVWPQFYQLLPDDVKREHDRPTEKTTRSQTVLAQEDMDAMNSSLMVGKLSGAV